MTPGQICYEAYTRVRIATIPTIPFAPWDQLKTIVQHAWETAAAAVAADMRNTIRAEQQKAMGAS